METKKQVFNELLEEWEEKYDANIDEFSTNFKADKAQRDEEKAEWKQRYEDAQDES